MYPKKKAKTSRTFKTNAIHPESTSRASTTERTQGKTTVSSPIKPKPKKKIVKKVGFSLKF